MTNAAAVDDALLHPADEAHLREYARGNITARDVARRVLERLEVPLPAGLNGDREADAAHVVLAPEEMSEDTQAFARGDLDVAGWLANAQRRYAGR